MKQNIASKILFLPIIYLVFSLNSCDTFDPEAEVPAYFQIDSVLVETTSEQGVSAHRITDVWFNLDGSNVGVFETPTRFPVIAKGRRLISIGAGVKKTGVNDLRIRHPFYERIKDTIDFVGTEVIKYTPKFKYIKDIKFWIEDFQDPGIDFHTNDSTNYMMQIDDPDNPNNKIGQVILPDSVTGFINYTDESFVLQTTSVFMEFDYKSTHTIGVGIIVTHPNGQKESVSPFALIKPKEDWNKLYFNLGEQFAQYPSATEYEVFFFYSGAKDQISEFYVDNFKILRHKN